MEVRDVKYYLKNIDGFIEDVEPIYKHFNLNEKDLKKILIVLEQVVEHNNIFLMKKDSEVNELERVKKEQESKKKEELEVEKPEEKPKSIKKNRRLKQSDNTQIYVDFIDGNMDLEMVLEDIMRKNDSENIIRKIILHYYAELKVYYELLKEDNSQETRNEINKINNIIESLNIAISLDESEDLDEVETIEANYGVSFYQSTQGTIDFLSDIKGYNPEVYPIFLELLNSILEGKPISYRKLNNNNALSGIKEVRKGQCRIAYVIDKNHCFILHAFVKKTWVDKGAFNNMSSRLSKLNRHKDKMLSEYKKEDFIIQLNEVKNFIENNRRLVKNDKHSD